LDYVFDCLDDDEGALEMVFRGLAIGVYSLDSSGYSLEIGVRGLVIGGCSFDNGGCSLEVAFISLVMAVTPGSVLKSVSTESVQRTVSVYFEFKRSVYGRHPDGSGWLVKRVG